MSSEKTRSEKKNGYIERLIEICGTRQPNEVAQILDVSYQAARNYLNGRLPEAEVLLKISERTRYSIHWLLTGDGEKFVLRQDNLSTLLLSDQLKQLVRNQCLEIFNELFDNQREASQEKIVKLSSKQIKAEKKLDESITSAKNSLKKN